jgi:hypothetical protein
MASRLAALGALLLCGATPALAQATIEWEVLHRFRVITHEAQQAGFLRRALGGGSATEVLADLYGVGRDDVLTICGSATKRPGTPARRNTREPGSTRPSVESG